jgi:uncharacterized protein
MTKYRLEVYSDTAGKWRWRAVSSNGKTLGSSGQGFASKQSAERNARLNGFS